MTSRLTKSCPDCGQLCDRRSERCQDCAKQTRKVNAIGQHDRCINCGQLTGDRGHRAKRCRECWVRYRDTRPQRPCTVEGCPQPHRAKGYCIDHYQKFVQTPLNRTGEGRHFLRAIRARPCQLCGYCLMPSHTHRLVSGAEGGIYEAGNVVGLCARCHEEVHRGLTQPPSAHEG